MSVKQIKIIKSYDALEKKKIRVGAYCRVSSDSEDQGNSLLAQMQYYSDYINSNPDMVFVDLYADEGITGTSIKKRDAFKRMISDCKNRRLDRILVKSVTRFARNSLECLESIRLMSSYGVSVYFENDGINTKNMNSEMVLYIKSAFAQGEAVSASKRMRTSVKMRMEDGTYVNSSAPYGYRLVDNQLIIEPSEAKIVKKIFQLYLSGKGRLAIVNELNKLENKGAWNISKLRYILTNESYTGKRIYGKTFTKDFPSKRCNNNGERDMFIYGMDHDAIISEETFKKADEIREKRESERNVSGMKRGFLNGKIFCRHCGWKYREVWRNKTLYWQCSRKGLAENVCHSPSYSDKDIKRNFIVLLLKVKENEKILLDETINELQQLKRRVNSESGEILSIDEKLKKLKIALAEYARLFQTSGLAEEIYLNKTDAIRCEMDDLKGRRKAILKNDKEENCIEQLRILKRNIDDYDNSTEFDEDFFNKVVQKIYIEEDNRITYVLKGGLEFTEVADNGSC